MHPTPPPRRLALALLFALAAALLAACGGAPAAFPQASSGLGDASRESPQQMGAMPTAAPAMGGGVGGAPGGEHASADSAAAPAPAAEGEAMSPASAPAAGGEDSFAETTGAAPVPAGEPETPGAPAPPSRPVGPEAALRAGEIDDNDRFADYLAYLQGYGSTGVRPADVSERVLIRVLDDNQRPVLDAQITIYDGERPVFRGRTYAGGQTIFHPRLADTANAASFRVVAEFGQASAETTFARGATDRVELGLRGASAERELRLDLLFMLDTTGSMGDELTKVQSTIDSIAQRIDAFTPRPSIRYGLVAYRDEGDAYVTRPFPFTDDLATFRGRLNELSADGGGDTPEAVDEALYESVVRADWRDEPAVRLVFLVADAAPHVPGRGQFSYLDGAREAVSKGVKIYPIAASNTDPDAEYVFRQLAQQTMGGFVFLTYQPGASGGAPGESTTLEAGEQAYTVERLDDLIVAIVERELGAAVGAR